MQIHKNFSGGNICVEKTEGNTIYLKNELRDTVGDWFYWAFCVEGAQGKTLNFEMEQNRVGYFGPAVSHDFKHWSWLNPAQMQDKNSFSYTFSETEDKVYFAHSMLYPTSRFSAFCDANNLEIKEFCKSKKGRGVPYITFGEGEKAVLLTARHHACESTGSYVLEGVLQNLLKNPVPGLKFICIPFVDYDGVTDGDQGKNRSPHDHNRDYAPTEPPVHPETAEIRRMIAENNVVFGFDFHSPWHKGDVHDRALIVQNDPAYKERYDRFGALLESFITPDAFFYQQKDDLAPNTSWNKFGNHNFSSHVQNGRGGYVAFTLETPYFGTKDNQFTQQRGIALGDAFGNAIRAYCK